MSNPNDTLQAELKKLNDDIFDSLSHAMHIPSHLLGAGMVAMSASEHHVAHLSNHFPRLKFEAQWPSCHVAEVSDSIKGIDT